VRCLQDLLPALGATTWHRYGNHAGQNAGFEDTIGQWFEHAVESSALKDVDRLPDIREPVLWERSRPDDTIASVNTGVLR
jgi:hypothetical protein